MALVLVEIASLWAAMVLSWVAALPSSNSKLKLELIPKKISSHVKGNTVCKYDLFVGCLN